MLTKTRECRVCASFLLERSCNASQDEAPVRDGGPPLAPGDLARGSGRRGGPELAPTAHERAPLPVISPAPLRPHAEPCRGALAVPARAAAPSAATTATATQRLRRHWCGGAGLGSWPPPLCVRPSIRTGHPSPACARVGLCRLGNGGGGGGGVCPVQSPL